MSKNNKEFLISGEKELVLHPNFRLIITSKIDKPSFNTVIFDKI